MIKLENVSKYYNSGGSVALGLHNVSCEMFKGEIIAVVGESGSGKSTFLNVITGVDTYEEGEIYFNGEETSYFNLDDLEKFRRNNVGFVFQNYNLIDSYTVLQNVMMPLIIRGYNYLKAKEEALKIIDKVGLSKRVSHKSTKLSGGEKQRCVIARALASDAPILACDEPTGNLDSKTGKEIIELIKSVASDRLVLIVTHNYDEVKDIATRRIRFYDGDIVEDVVLKKEEIKEEKIISTEDHSFNYKDSLKLAWQNLIATPKKTIFSLIVFFAIAILVGVIYQNCYIQSQESGYGYSNEYQNLYPNRLVVFDKNQKALDLDKITSVLPNEEIITNSFFEDMRFSSRISNWGDTTVMLVTSLRASDISLTGKMPINNDEIILGVEKSFLTQVRGDLLDQTIEIQEKTYKIVGYFNYYSGQYGVFVHGNEFTNKTLKEKNLLSYQIGVMISDNSETISIPADDKSLEKGKLVINTNSNYLIDNYKSMNIYYFFGDVYKIEVSKENISVEYSESIGIRMNYETVLDIYEENCFQASLYPSNIASAKEKLEDLGYSVHEPAKPIGTNIEVILNQLFFYFLLAISTLGVLGIYLFSYIILSRIYASKNKDYTMLRTLGLNKQNMAGIVRFEIFIICFSATLLSIIFIFIGNKTTNAGFFAFFDTVTIWRVLGFLIVMSWFSLLMSKRFNKRLFKFSINTSLKREAVSND